METREAYDRCRIVCQAMCLYVCYVFVCMLCVCMHALGVCV